MDNGPGDQVFSLMGKGTTWKKKERRAMLVQCLVHQAQSQLTSMSRHNLGPQRAERKLIEDNVLLIMD